MMFQPMRMQTILRYFFSTVCLVEVLTSAVAQNKKEEADTVKQKYLPTGIRIGTDLISIIKSQAGDKFSGWEINADVDFYRYYLTVDYGSWARSEQLYNGTYENSGTYYRIGADINFLLKDPDRNMFFLGFRYGRSNFDETVNYTFTDPDFGSFQRSVTTSQIGASWAELTSGLRVKIWKGLWMGYTIRFKFGASTSATPGVVPFDIPGYGLADTKTYWGINYLVFWRFPLRKVN